MSSYVPPYSITTPILKYVSEISELVAEIKYIDKNYNTLKLRKKNRVRSITGTLQIEGNSFDEEKVISIINGKRVLGAAREIEEVKGAIKAYDNIENYHYQNEQDLLLAHRYMMGGILTNAGAYRSTNVGVGGKEGVAHVAPPPYMVPKLMGELFEWLKNTQEHLLIVSCVFHYEFEFIHPFSDGNGRIGRFWQSVILKEYRAFFAYMPIESMVKENQEHYYKALQDATSAAQSTPFIEFMLEVIANALKLYIKESQKSDQKSIQKSDQKIVSLIRQNSKITINELSEKTGLSPSGVKKIIKKLKDDGLLLRVGSLKGGHWEIVDEV